MSFGDFDSFVEILCFNEVECDQLSITVGYGRTITHLLAVIGQDTRIEVATILLLLCDPGSHSFVRRACSSSVRSLLPLRKMKTNFCIEFAASVFRTGVLLVH